MQENYQNIMVIQEIIIKLLKYLVPVTIQVNHQKLIENLENITIPLLTLLELCEDIIN
jgi:hypothetical protein